MDEREELPLAALLDAFEQPILLLRGNLVRRANAAARSLLGAYVEGTYEKMFAGHTPTDYYVTATGAKFLHSDWRGGAELDVASLKLGLKGNF